MADIRGPLVLALALGVLLGFALFRGVVWLNDHTRVSVEWVP